MIRNLYLTIFVFTSSVFLFNINADTRRKSSEEISDAVDIIESRISSCNTATQNSTSMNTSTLFEGKWAINATTETLICENYSVPKSNLDSYFTTNTIYTETITDNHPWGYFSEVFQRKKHLTSEGLIMYDYSYFLYNWCGTVLLEMSFSTDKTDASVIVAYHRHESPFGRFNYSKADVYFQTRSQFTVEGNTFNIWFIDDNTSSYYRIENGQYNQQLVDASGNITLDIVLEDGAANYTGKIIMNKNAFEASATGDHIFPIEFDDPSIGQYEIRYNADTYQMTFQESTSS